MTYPGGKNGSGVYQTIINLIPPHNVYIEPFLGSGAILRMKRPAPHGDYGIDINYSVITDFKAKYGSMDHIGLYHGDYLDVCFKWGFGVLSDQFMYLDPPYLMETRSTQRPLYQYEYATKKDHNKLLDFVLDLSCMVMISGYDSDLYNDRLKGWNKITYQAMTRSGRPATECLWMNYPEPMELHQYDFLGDDYRERERIKRKQARWKNRLMRLDRLERLAIMAALDGMRSGQHR